MSEPTIKVKVMLDGSVVAAGVEQVQVQIAKIGQAADKSVGQATQAVQTHTQAWNRAGQSVTDSLQKIAAAAGLAFSVDRMVRFVATSIQAAERIENLSQALGVSTQNLQAMSYIAGHTGTTLDTVSGAMARLSRATVEARDGNVQTAAAFQALGVKVTDVHGKLKPTDQLIVEIAQHLATMKAGGDKTAIMIELMGRGAAEATPFFNALGREFNTLKARAEELGIVLSAKDQAALVNMQYQIEELGQEIKGLGNQFSIALLPVLTQVVAKLQELALSGEVKNGMREISNAAQFVVDNFDAITQIIKTLLELKLLTWAENAAGGIRSIGIAADGSRVKIISLQGAFGLLGAAIVGWNFGTYLSDNFRTAQAVGNIFFHNMMVGWERFRQGAEIAWAAIHAVAEVSMRGISEWMAKVSGGAGLAALMTGNIQLAQKLKTTSEEFQKQADAMGKAGSVSDVLKNKIKEINAATDQRIAKAREDQKAEADSIEIEFKHRDALKLAQAGYQSLNDIAGAYLNTLANGKPVQQDEVNAIIAIRAQAVLLEKSGADLNATQIEAGRAIARVANAYMDATAKAGHYNSQAAATASKTKEETQVIAGLEVTLSRLAGQLGGPYVAAGQAFVAVIVRNAEALSKLTVGTKAYNDALILSEQIKALARQVRDEEIKNIKTQNDLLAQSVLAEENEQKVLSVAPQYRDALREALQDYDASLKKHMDFTGQQINNEEELRRNLDQQLPALVRHKQAIKDITEEEKKQVQASKEWQQIIISGFDSFGQSIAQFATGGIKTWHDFWQAILGDAKQMIAAIIAQMLRLTVWNTIVNSLFGWTGTAMALPTGLGSLAAAFGGGMLGGVSGGATSVANLALTAGPFAGSVLSGSLSGGAGQAGSVLGLLSRMFGGGGGDTIFKSGFETGTGWLGRVLGVGASVLAGLGEFGAAGGGIPGLMGAAAYGIGTYAVGAGITAAISGGISAGVSAASLSSLGFGPIGWIAAGAMILNMLTGGGLFGTAWKPTGASISTLNVGQTGASFTNQYEESRKAPFFGLFGGSTRKWVTQGGSPEQQAAAATFFDALVKGVTAFTESLGQTFAGIVGGQFITRTDKSGNVTTESVVLGQTYKGETSEQFAKRLQADSFLAVLDRMGIGASQFVAGLQNDADKLFEAVQDIANTTAMAQADIKKGRGLLGEGGTIDQVVNLVMKFSNASETLVQTYTRLENETQVVKAYTDYLGISLGVTGEALVTMIDDMAQAAGGLQQLDDLWGAFIKSYFTPAEQSAMTIAALKGKVEKDFNEIGETLGVSAQQFREDVLNALQNPDLSGAQKEAWLQAAKDFADLNSELQSAANTAAQAKANYESFMQSFYKVLNPLTAFEQAIVDLGNSFVDNMRKANELAIANGMASATASDYSAILAVSIQQGVALLIRLQQEAQDISAQLFGSTTDQLKQQLADAQARVDRAHAHAGYDIADQQLIVQLKEKIAAQEKLTLAQSQFLQAVALLGDLGQIAAITGQSLGDFSKMFGIPLDKFAKMLGTDEAGLQKDFEQQQALARAAFDTAGNTKFTNQLLKDILAAYLGEPLPYSWQDLAGSGGGGPIPFINTGKPGARGYAPPKTGGTPQPAEMTFYSDSIVSAVNKSAQASADRIVSAIRDLIAEVKNNKREASNAPRNTAGKTRSFA